MRKLNFGLLIVVFFLSGCAVTVPTTPHSQENISEYKKFKAPANASRVYFLTGLTTGHILSLRHNWPSALLVDGKVIGQISKSDVLVVDMKPGRYEFMWRPANSNDSKLSKPLALNLVAGETIYLRSEWNVGGGGFGFIGAMINPGYFNLISDNDTSGITELNFVKPTDCPNTICVNTK